MCPVVVFCPPVKSANLSSMQGDRCVERVFAEKPHARREGVPIQDSGSWIVEAHATTGRGHSADTCERILRWWSEENRRHEREALYGVEWQLVAEFSETDKMWPSNWWHASVDQITSSCYYNPIRLLANPGIDSPCRLGSAAC